MAQIITDVFLDEHITIKVSKEYKCKLPSFGMLVNRERRTAVEGLNMHDILQNLSKGATFLFWDFIKKRNPNTNEVRYLPTDSAERRSLTKAYKELNQLEVIQRIRQGEYLISPLAYVPSNNNFDAVLEKWKELQNTGDTNGT